MSTAQPAIKTDKQSRVSDAIHRARAYLLAQQNLEGYWWAELEANVTLTAEYIMLHRILIAADIFRALVVDLNNFSRYPTLSVG